MEQVTTGHRAFVAQLASDNRKFYGSHDGRSLLKVIGLTFDHSWIYLYELVQNALDVGAKSIAIRTGEDGEALIFQHDGIRPLEERDVEGLSKIFRSTKGARSVGFMGIGFKSVFTRFREAQISGWGWKFRYEVTQVTGAEFGDVQRDFLGAVIPIWDNAVSPPDSGYTTRFELRRRTVGETPLESDLGRFLPDNDRASLAILAMSGLERLEINNRVWELSAREIFDGTYEATALSESQHRLWRVFPVDFQPSTNAIACFLEHRSIQPEEGDRQNVYADAARLRRVLGVLPLDDNGIAAPPPRGHVYATLPTDVTLPFGLHINADWLLNISRTGLSKIEDNAWQRDIAGTIPEILTNFLVWSASAHSTPDAAKAAFEAIGNPSSEAGGLESLFAEKSWLAKFRDRLRVAAVIPVWTKSVDDLAYAKPGDVIVPPPSIAKILRRRPEIKPAALLHGPVLMDEVLGTATRQLLRTLGLLTEVSPESLESTWKGGLEDWWNTLPDGDKDRRTLLFRLWAAVAELTVQDAWRGLRIRCVLSMTGSWITVDEAAYFKESLATEHEPGGRQTRRLMQSVVRDANRLAPEWVTALRQPSSPHRYTDSYIPRAWHWIEKHASGIGLRDIVDAALGNGVLSNALDPSVYTSFGHWAKHRNRPDLLCYVLVRSNGDIIAKPINESLLAAPYVQFGDDRQRLWTDVPVIDGAYLETDPNSTGAHEWRTFFEKAGARGRINVRTLTRTASRRDRKRVAKYLGQDTTKVPECNDNGYTLEDFDIEPSLPAQDAPLELRAAVAPLIQDGFGKLKDRGRRKISYFWYSPSQHAGLKPSTWVRKLCEMAWVPCGDGELRRPRGVLREHDPAPAEAPVSKLLPNVSIVLEQEGVEFGTDIPKATSLSRLSAVGSDLEATELAHLLNDCRKHATTDADRNRFVQILKELTLPTMENERVKINRLVKRVSGRFRGLLGNWIIPLEQIDKILRVELEHPEFPYELPETTTGDQALSYILNVWHRARSSPQRLANEVRDVLPTAYGYVLEDVGGDTVLSSRWKKAVPQAMLFSENEWVALSDVGNVYFDDIEDRRFLPKQSQFRVVTAGHLGRNRQEQLRTIEEISLPRLSSMVKMNWIAGDEEVPISDAWKSRFARICDVLRSIRGTDADDGCESDTGTRVRLFRARELALDVGVGDSPVERVPVHARLREETLTVTGRPVQFGADAAKELLRRFSFGQRASLAADLTGMFVAIDSCDFELAGEKFQRSHAPEYHEVNGERAGTVGSESESNAGNENSASNEDSTGDKGGQDGKMPISDVAGAFDETHNDTTGTRRQSRGGSYSRDRAMARQNALAGELKNSLKGEIVPDPGGTERMRSDSTNGGAASGLGDEEYREIVLRYERNAGRKPVLGDPHQSGWDIRSIDPQTGKVRLIEVKGRSRPWDADEVVELSSAQVRKAFEAAEHWYLYVVEKVDENTHRVLPIENPARNAAKWILCGESWRMVADDARVVPSTLD